MITVILCTLGTLALLALMIVIYRDKGAPDELVKLEEELSRHLNEKKKS